MPHKGEVEIVVQGEIGGATIALTGSASEGAGPINERLDLMTKALGRQKSRGDLAEKLLALEINAKMLAGWEERFGGAMRARAEDRARLVAAYRAQHEASGKRMDYKPNTAQKQGLDNFDKQTETEKGRLEKERQDYQRDRPIIESQISRLRAIIAGRDPTEFVPDAEDAAAAA